MVDNITPTSATVKARSNIRQLHARKGAGLAVVFNSMVAIRCEWIMMPSPAINLSINSIAQSKA